MSNEVLQALQRYADLTARGRKSSALAPLQWALVIMTSATVGSTMSAPIWITAVFLVGDALLLLTYIGAFTYFMLQDPDALRSERYNIQKRALERLQLGDSDTGLHTVVFDENDQTETSPLRLSDSSSPDGGDA